MRRFLLPNTVTERAGHAAAPTNKIGGASRPPSVMACAMPLSNGMTATGSHEYFYSLRGAQPPGGGYFALPGQAFPLLPQLYICPVAGFTFLLYTDGRKPKKSK